MDDMTLKLLNVKMISHNLNYLLGSIHELLYLTGKNSMRSVIGVEYEPNQN